MRLFIALPLPGNVEEYLGSVISDFRRKRGRVKWVESKNIHLTLKFLGETDENILDVICQSIKRVAQNRQAVSCCLDRIGGFPNLKRPKVIWAGLRDNIEKLVTIASEIEDEMVSHGFERENRPFKSHLTLGRIKENSGLHDLTEHLKDYRIRPEPILFDKIILFKSTLTPRGPIYESLFSQQLNQK